MDYCSHGLYNNFPERNTLLNASQCMPHAVRLISLESQCMPHAVRLISLESQCVPHAVRLISSVHQCVRMRH